MIDFIRTYSFDIDDELKGFIESSPDVIDPQKVYSIDKSNTDFPFKGKIKNIELIRYKTRGFISGSIHKFYNLCHEYGEQNHSDFYLQDIETSVKQLIIDCPIIENNILTQLEFGLNLEVPIAAKNIIDENLLFHNWKSAGNIETFDGKGYLKRFNQDDFQIKIYDKAKQYSLSTALMRIEIKLKNNKHFKQIGIKKVKDLYDTSCIKPLFQLLLKRVEELIIIDRPNKNSLSKEQEESYNKYTNLNYWKGFSRKERNKKSKEIKKAKALFNELGLLKTKNYLGKALKEKFKLLSNPKTVT